MHKNHAFTCVVLICIYFASMLPLFGAAREILNNPPCFWVCNMSFSFGASCFLFMFSHAFCASMSSFACRKEVSTIRLGSNVFVSPDKMLISVLFIFQWIWLKMGFWCIPTMRLYKNSRRGFRKLMVNHVSSAKLCKKFKCVTILEAASFAGLPRMITILITMSNHTNR